LAGLRGLTTEKVREDAREKAAWDQVEFIAVAYFAPVGEGVGLGVAAGGVQGDRPSGADLDAETKRKLGAHAPAAVPQDSAYSVGVPVPTRRIGSPAPLAGACATWDSASCGQSRMPSPSGRLR